MFSERFRLRNNWLGGRCNVRTFEGHTQGVSCVQFDDTRIVSGSSDKTIKVITPNTLHPPPTTRPSHHPFAKGIDSIVNENSIHRDCDRSLTNALAQKLSRRFFVYNYRVIGLFSYEGPNLIDLHSIDIKFSYTGRNPDKDRDR